MRLEQVFESAVALAEMAVESELARL